MTKTYEPQVIALAKCFSVVPNKNGNLSVKANADFTLERFSAFIEAQQNREGQGEKTPTTELVDEHMRVRVNGKTADIDATREGGELFNAICDRLDGWDKRPAIATGNGFKSAADLALAVKSARELSEANPDDTDLAASLAACEKALLDFTMAKALDC